MTKVLAFLFFSIFSSSVLAGFSPIVGGRPHTLCWEKENRFAGFHIYLTDLKTETGQTRVDISEISQQDEHLVLSQVTQSQVRDSAEVYEGIDFWVEINREYIAGSSQRSARLVFTLENGEEIRKALLCDSLMYPMGKGRANF